jgi:hypothetical protein
MSPDSWPTFFSPPLCGVALVLPRRVQNGGRFFYWTSGGGGDGLVVGKEILPSDLNLKVQKGGMN